VRVVEGKGREGIGKRKLEGRKEGRGKNGSDTGVGGGNGIIVLCGFLCMCAFYGFLGFSTRIVPLISLISLILLSLSLSLEERIRGLEGEED